uniref:Uncharacterized protein n=1 Tax=Anguilla anguilla TaxID=7936 RepID=A0A0E9S4N7_ANGAN
MGQLGVAMPYWFLQLLAAPASPVTIYALRVRHIER